MPQMRPRYKPTAPAGVALCPLLNMVFNICAIPVRVRRNP